MKDTRFGEIVVDQFAHLFQGRAIALTPPFKRAVPQTLDMFPECRECSSVGRHCVVGKMACDDLLEPFSLFGNRPMHALTQLLFDLRKFSPHAVTPGFPHEQKASPPRFSADVGEPEKIKRLRFAAPTPFSV
jgi:hypothetical protein